MGRANSVRFRECFPEAIFFTRVVLFWKLSVISNGFIFDTHIGKCSCDDKWPIAGVLLAGAQYLFYTTTGERDYVIWNSFWISILIQNTTPLFLNKSNCIFRYPSVLLIFIDQICLFHPKYECYTTGAFGICLTLYSDMQMAKVYGFRRNFWKKTYPVGKFSGRNEKWKIHRSGGQ